ncbi:MAG: HAMP domain-containing sensor histidine kinase [Leptospirales bacterium]
MTLLIFLPLTAVALALLQQGAYRTYSGWRRRESRRTYENALRRLDATLSETVDEPERLAHAAAILPGHATAVYSADPDLSLRVLHRAQRPTPSGDGVALQCFEILEHKREIRKWIKSLKAVNLASAILHDAAAPRSASHRRRAVAQALWPWRPRRAGLYLVRLGSGSDTEFWAAGFYDDHTYIPPGHSFTEQWHALLTPRRADASKTHPAAARYAPDSSGEEHRHILRANRDAHLARVIHDVRLPMTRLFAMLESLQDQVRALAWNADPEIAQTPAVEVEQSFARIARQLRTMESFTYDILNLESEGAADQNQKTARLDLAEHIRQIVDAHLDLIERKRITVEYEFPVNGPAVLADPMALDRILFNLLTNSFQFCSSPGKIYLALEARSRHVLLSIEDSGRGLVSQENTFDLARRNNGRGGGGWGLGLASARDLSRRLGGRLLPARSRHGKGARFLLVLPGVSG